MNQYIRYQGFDEAEKLLKQGFAPETVQAFAERTVATSKDFYEKAAGVAQDGAKAFTEIAETAWGSTKLLNEKVAQNIAANTEAVFTFAQAITAAKSLPEIGKIQADFVTKFAARAAEQTKEFADLSTRATQHILEKAQTAAAKGFKVA